MKKQHEAGCLWRQSECYARYSSRSRETDKYKELEIVKPINIKIMMALIEKEPGDQYIPVLKPVLMQILTEIKHLRRKNSQLGGKNARLRREKKALEIMLS